MLKILMIGNNKTVHGGITSVVNQILEHDWENDKITYLPSYNGGSSINKLIYFAKSLIKFITIILFKKPDVVYYHMSHHGSFDRKYTFHKICKLFGIPDIIHLHGSEFQAWYDEVSKTKQEKVRKFLKECGAIIVLGEKWYDRINNIV